METGYGVDGTGCTLWAKCAKISIGKETIAKEIGTSRRFLTDDEREARKLIVEWAKRHYDDPEGHTPKVEIVEITYEWDAELEVEGWADNPNVSFWIDEDKEVIITAGPDY